MNRDTPVDRYLVAHCLWETHVTGAVLCDFMMPPSHFFLVLPTTATGRSTTTMCAAFVRAGFCGTWQEAFRMIKEKRPVVRLNKKMKAALAQWQDKYVLKKD